MNTKPWVKKAPAAARGDASTAALWWAVVSP
jgi:hypothetical protein